MRRSVSPRETVHRHFRMMERRLKTLPASETREVLLGDLDELRDLAISFTADQPALDPAHFGRWLDGAHHVSVKHSIERHLARQIPLVGFESVPAEEMTAAALAALDAVDPEKELEGELARVATQTVAGFPQIAAQGFHADRLEALLRESLGLEGTPPAPESDRIASLANARKALTGLKACMAAERTVEAEEAAPCP
jgi:hypothetical protein